MKKANTTVAVMIKTVAVKMADLACGASIRSKSLRSPKVSSNS